jgi:hypothetical protein
MRAQGCEDDHQTIRSLSHTLTFTRSFRSTSHTLKLPFILKSDVLAHTVIDIWCMNGHGTLRHLPSPTVAQLAPLISLGALSECRDNYGLCQDELIGSKILLGDDRLWGRHTTATCRLITIPTLVWQVKYSASLCWSKSRQSTCRTKPFVSNY